MNGLTKMNDVYELICGKMLRVLDAEDQASADFLNKQHVFIVGSKGIPAQYGGFETYVEKMVEYQTDKNIQFHVARLADNEKRYEYNGAICFNVKVPDIGPAKAVYYDIAALEKCIKYCSKMNLRKPPIFYVLACRIGPFIGYLKRRIQKLGGVLLVNPDGHEWKRSKWSLPIRKYWSRKPPRKKSRKRKIHIDDCMSCHKEQGCTEGRSQGDGAIFGHACPDHGNGAASKHKKEQEQADHACHNQCFQVMVMGILSDIIVRLYASDLVLKSSHSKTDQWTLTKNLHRIAEKYGPLKSIFVDAQPLQTPGDKSGHQFVIQRNAVRYCARCIFTGNGT